MQDTGRARLEATGAPKTVMLSHVVMCVQIQDHRRHGRGGERVRRVGVEARGGDGRR